MFRPTRRAVAALIAGAAFASGSALAADAPKQIAIDWATYNPVSIILKEKGLLEKEFEKDGILAKDAAKIVMKCLYGARFVRYDLLWPIGDLARKISKWTKACDRRLDRFIGYLKGTLDDGLEGFVGDPPHRCQVLAYCDA